MESGGGGGGVFAPGGPVFWGIPTGPATPLTRWATRCPGHRSIRRSIPTSHGSREGRPMAVSYASYLRSEEHTSELQSQSNLVCRLLLEKKNTYLKTESA